MSEFLNISKFSWIWQGSEYASGCNYVRVLNIPGFRVCQVSAHASAAQGSEYGWIMPYDRVLNMSGQRFAVLNKLPVLTTVARLWICEGYTGCWICLNKPVFTLMYQYTWIWLNKAEYDWIYRHIPSINISSKTQQKEAPQGNILKIFPLYTLKTTL